MTLERRQERRDTAANWASNNSVLADGEIGVASDAHYFKVGDGSTAWNSITRVYPASDATATLTNKDLTGSGNTFPTFNQNTTGTAAGITGKTTPTGALVGTTDTQTLSGKTESGVTITGYTEGVAALGTVTSTATISISSGTYVTATLTSATACTFTMPTATAGASFLLLLKQPASGTATTATFTSVKWPGGTAPTITATVGKADTLSFHSDGTNWYGASAQNYTY